MLLLVGTVPVEGLPVTVGRVHFDREFAIGDGFRLQAGELLHCTTAMMATAALACRVLGQDAPYGVTAGDLGDGSGSRLIYNFLAEEAGAFHPRVLTLHYMMPHLLLAEIVMDSVRKWDPRPILIADAGGMYAMKGAGLAREFDLFTPDPGEMAFLADPEAVHPAYVRRLISEVDLTEVPRLIEEAHRHGNAPKVLLVKGATDFIARDGQVVETVSAPDIPCMECIGGTGDTITGLVSALAYAGYDLAEAAIQGARINRLAGRLAEPTPATPVGEIIRHIPAAMEEALGQGVRTS